MALSEREIRDCITPGQLQLILLPTEACDLRCVYCYEEFKYSRMERSVVRGVKNLLTRRAMELDHLTLSWFGGEPLLALDVMEDVLRHAGRLLDDHPAMRLSSDVTTNGMRLTPPVFERLLDLGVTRYHISFDGPREYHDRRRVRANGDGTFDRIWHNLLALVEVPREFTVVVQLHVDQENRTALPGFIGEIERATRGDERFRVYLMPLSRLGGANDGQLPTLEGPAVDAALEQLTHSIQGGRVRQVTDGDYIPVCHAARANSWVVRANGRLNKCTVALEHPTNQVGHLHEDGRLELVQPKLQRWMRGLYSGHDGELSCPKRGLADGRVPPA